jgi:nucleotide-binding universal stress UspA family protein
MTPYTQILCPIDGSLTANRGMQEAAAIAKSTGAKVHFFHVVDFHPALYGYESAAVAPQMIEAIQTSGAEIVARALQFATEQGLDASFGSVEAFATRVSDAIIDEAERCNADLIVLGTHGRRGIKRLLIGSDAEAVARQAPCAVMLVRPPVDPS